METIYLSPSGLATLENCPRSYQFSRVLKVRTRQTSCHLGFGGAAGSAAEVFLRGTVRGQFVDPVPVFIKLWNEFCDRHHVRYKRGMSRERLQEIGVRLLTEFPDAWRKSGFTVALDRHGEPIVERKLRVNVGCGVVLVTKLDILVVDSDGNYVLLDLKTPGKETSVEFTLTADQLTAYQLALQVYAQELGIGEISGVGYWELLKKDLPKTTRGKGPEVLEPLVVRPRSDQEIDQFVEKLHFAADNIRCKRFPKTPRMAYNTPCGACDELPLCLRGESEEFTFPDENSKRIALSLAA